MQADRDMPLLGHQRIFHSVVGSDQHMNSLQEIQAERKRLRAAADELEPAEATAVREAAEAPVLVVAEDVSRAVPA